MSQPDQESLAERFEQARPRLKGLARRMLGSEAEAEDAVQEAWLRLAQADAAAITNLGGWLTTVLARLCLDQLRRRKTRGEESLDDGSAEPAAPDLSDPEREALLAESVEQALALVLERLAPAERVAFVLHDLFELSFEDVARVLDKSEVNARQLASRARRRVKEAGREGPPAPRDGRALVEAFLAASRQGDFNALVALLDPNVVLRVDPLAVQVAAANRAKGLPAPVLVAESRGPAAVAEAFKGRAQGARAARVDGRPGAVWMQGSEIRTAFVFSFAQGRISALSLVMDPADLAALNIELD